jgi:hypothetical protein
VHGDGDHQKSISGLGTATAWCAGADAKIRKIAHPQIDGHTGSVRERATDRKARGRQGKLTGDKSISEAYHNPSGDRCSVDRGLSTAMPFCWFVAPAVKVYRATK